MKLKKIFLITSIIFALCLCFGLTVAAETYTGNFGTDGNNLSWSLDSNGLLTINGTGNMNDYTIGMWGDKPPWNRYSDRIKTVEIKYGVTSIGGGTFYGCRNLESIIIPNSVTRIGNYAFGGCSSISSITLPINLTNLEGSPFYNCSNLVSVNIPRYITTLEVSMFSGCTSLTSINVDGNNQAYMSQDGVLFDKTMKTLIKYPAGKTDTSYSIPNSVTNIGDYSFQGCNNFKNITIPNSVKEIGEWAFRECKNLTTIAIPDTVTILGEDVFMDCKSLSSVTISNNLTNIPSYTFYGCTSLTNVTLPAGITSIDSRSFYACSNLSSISIPNTVTSIGSEAFRNCTNLVNAEIPNSVTNLASYCFYGCASLKSLTIPENITSLPYGAFWDCTGLTEIKWNAKNISDLEDDESSAFDCAGQNAGGIKVVFGDKVESIPAYAFCPYESKSADAPKITSVVLGNNVKSIGKDAFYSCENLESVTMSDSVTSIGNYAFYYNKNLKNIIIPDKITTIGYGTFYGCSSLVTVDIGYGVSSIDSHAFYGCTGLKTVTVDDENQYYKTQDGVLFDKAKQTLILYPASRPDLTYTIPNTVTKIGNSAFYYCEIIENITIPDSVTSIGSSAFYYCSNLKDVTIGENVTSIGNSAFYYCKGLTKINWNAKSTADFSSNNQVFGYAGQNGDGITVTFGNTVEKIPAYAFYPYSYGTSYTPKITKVFIDENITSVGKYAFYYCSSITDVHYSDSSEEWAKITIDNYNTPLTSATVHCTDSCDILSIISPEGGTLNATDKTITFNVANSLTSFTPEFELSYGASWNLYSTATATTAISKTVNLSREDRTYTRYIKILAADEETVNTYTVTFRRNTKSISPVITARRDVVTITAPNCKIYYTTDGSTPIAEGVGNESPCVFSSVDSKATVKAIAVEEGKDEISDIVTYEVPEYLTTTMTGIECFDNYNGTCDYMIMIQSDGVPSGEFIVVIYDTDGKMIGIKAEPKTIDKEETISGSINVGGTPHSYKAMLWDALGNLLPLCDNAEGLVE